MPRKTDTTQYRYGFTIVELLIVVVVIAILAAITVVAFTGIRKQATEAAAKTELNSLVKEFEIEKMTAGSSPANSQKIFRDSSLVSTEYSYGNTKYYCFVTRAKNSADTAFHITTKDGDASIKSGECPQPSFRTTYRCVTGRVASVATYQNDTSQNIRTNSYHSATSDSAEPQQSIAPGATASFVYSLRVASVPRGVITFYIYDTSGNLLETYYQASPAVNC